MRFELFRRARPLGFVGVLLASTTMFATEVSAQTLSTGFDPAATFSAGVRYRAMQLSNSSQPNAVRVFSGAYVNSAWNQASVTWGPSPSTKSVSITYDGSTLSTSVGGGAPTSRAVGSLGNLNYIKIEIARQAQSQSVALNNISLNGGASLGSAAVTAPTNTQQWNISGVNLTSGFTLNGTLSLTGLSGGGDSNYVQVEVGYLTPPDNKGPVTSSVTTAPIPALLNGQVTVTANVSDETTGNNNVASAQYELNGNGIWQAMAAQDGGFNSPNEDVQASFYATQLGKNTVCVRGTDALGNVGNASCQTFTVTYKFTGFFQPVDNEPAVNSAKAGQGVPVKWRLTDANDVPVAAPSSFVNLLSYPVACTDFSGDPTDTVEEVAAGSSGLQYLGDGYWQFNWKTPTTYANTCRAMMVEFDSGAFSPAAKFKFRK